MPEGDEVYRHAVRLRADLVGEPLEELVIRHRGSIEGARGREISSIATRGKHTLIYLAGRPRAAVHIHLGMNGGWRRTKPGAPRRRGDERASAILAVAACEWRCVHPMRAEVLEEPNIETHRSLRKLGPDLLGAEVDWDEIARRASAPHRARDSIADTLLDQTVACGIGTIYRSESLFVARQNPWAPLAALDDERILEIYRIARELLSMNLVPGRATRTTRPDDRRPAERAGDPSHYVYTRGGRPCLICGDAVEVRRHSEMARKTYYCRRCQIEEPRSAVQGQARAVGVKPGGE